MPAPPSVSCDDKAVFRHGQVVLGGQNHPQLRTTALQPPTRCPQPPRLSGCPLPPPREIYARGQHGLAWPAAVHSREGFSVLVVEYLESQRKDDLSNCGLFLGAELAGVMLIIEGLGVGLISCCYFFDHISFRVCNIFPP